MKRMEKYLRGHKALAENILRKKREKKGNVSEVI